MLGGTTESLLPVLIGEGFEPAEARREVEAAAASPYVRGADRLVNRLKKREWVLDIHRKLNRVLPGGDSIERQERLPRDRFLREYYTTNRPVVITGAMAHWPALKRWNPAYLRERFGDRTVEVQADRNADRRYESQSGRHRSKMRFADYIDKILASRSTNDYYMTANNSSVNSHSLRELWEDIGDIEEYLDPQADQPGFLWFGPAGTITPLHHDLTNNFMAQVYGRKLVKLIASCELADLANELHCYTDIDAENVDWQRFPQFKNVRMIDVIIGSGDLLFLPVGWWHYVKALDVSITVAFTNFIFDNDFYTSYSTYHEV